MKELIEFYTNKLQRKERLISDYMEEKNSIDGFKSSKREIEYNVLKSEIDLLKKFIEDLEDVMKEENILIDEGHKFDTTEQTECIKEIQKVSKFKLEK